MNLHQKLKSIESQRGRLSRRPSASVAATWSDPTIGPATTRSRLKIESKPSTEGQSPKRGRLEIGMINQQGGHDSLVQRSLTNQLTRFKKILDSYKRFGKRSFRVNRPKLESNLPVASSRNPNLDGLALPFPFKDHGRTGRKHEFGRLIQVVEGQAFGMDPGSVS